MRTLNAAAACSNVRSAARLCALAVLVLALASAAAAADIGKPGSDTVKQLFKQAERLIRKGDLAEAERSYRRILEIEPQNSDAKVELAFVHVKQRNYADAYTLSLAVAKDETKNARAFAVLGSALLGAGRFPEARAVFYTAIKHDRREHLAWAGFGMLEYYDNRIYDAIANLKEAIFHEADEPDYYFALAQVCARAERFRDAANAYRSFLRTSNDTDDERRARIKGLISFLSFLDGRSSLYSTAGRENTEVGFRLVSNRPVIEVRVNTHDRPLNFVLDTGSGISVISTETARRLGIKPITRGGTAKGIGGDGSFDIVYGFLRQVEIGDVAIKSVPVYIREFHATGENIDGYIGLSLISKFLTTIDYGSRTFSLAKKESADAKVADKQELALPLRLTSSGFLSGEVHLEGIDSGLNFIVDTGASVSVISDDIAGLSQISRFGRTETMRVIGSAGVTENVPSFLLPRVTFGKHSRPSVTAIALDLDMINEASGFEQAGILGGNFLKNYRLTFDFKNSRVLFTPVAQDQ